MICKSAHGFRKVFEKTKHYLQTRVPNQIQIYFYFSALQAKPPVAAATDEESVTTQVLTNVPSPELCLKVTTRSFDDGRDSGDEEPINLPLKSAVVAVPIATEITTDEPIHNIHRSARPLQAQASSHMPMDDDSSQHAAEEEQVDENDATPTHDSDTPSPTPVPTLTTLTESLPDN